MVPVTEVDIEDQFSVSEQALPVGTVLSDNQFTITGHLGAGGFGITYTANDNVLGRPVVIKECFPEDFCLREDNKVHARSTSYIKPVRSIVSMFMHEARSLAQLRHPNIVGVHGAFEENETAYMVLDLIDGPDLLDVLTSKKVRMPPPRVRDMLMLLLDAVEKVHELGLLHRDISPDNIIIEKNGTPVLIDFGAARADSSQNTRAVSSMLVVKDGYSPQEFYIGGVKQSPASDLYALAATFYHVLTGEAPPDSQARLLEIAGHQPDPCEPLEGRITGYDPEFLKSIDVAMRIHPKDRLQSAAQWREMILAGEESNSPLMVEEPEVFENVINLEIEQKLATLVEETNCAVKELQKSQPVKKENLDPVPQAKRTTSKPEWAEEFNRESLGLLEEDDDLGSNSLESEEQEPVRKVETDWIARALEKQELARQQLQEAYYEIAPEMRMDEPAADDNSFETPSNDIASYPVPAKLNAKASKRRFAFGSPVGLFVACFVGIVFVGF